MLKSSQSFLLKSFNKTFNFVLSTPGGGDRIYIKRDWFGTVMDKNYGVTKGNERLRGDQVTAR
jgi:ABC-type uncharacterized transport system YnjBCD substrate-binding protein